MSIVSSQLIEERVVAVKHWNDSLFSFQTTRSDHFRFQNGQFTMIGLQPNLLRAYSIVSANHEPYLEFFSIKVPDGKLTSQLSQINVGDRLLINKKSTGSLSHDHLKPGKRLILLATGTGLAPFLSIIRDPDVYDRFDQILLFHGCRYKSDLAYRQFITEKLPQHEFLAELLKDKLFYFPMVSREQKPDESIPLSSASHPTLRYGRISDVLAENYFCTELGIKPLDVATDRVLLCGGPAMLKTLSNLLEQYGFDETQHGSVGEFALERAFVERH